MHTFDFRWNETKNPSRSGTYRVKLAEDFKKPYTELHDSAEEKAHAAVEAKLGHTDFDLFTI